jgi:hypothetical protein
MNIFHAFRGLLLAFVLVVAMSEESNSQTIKFGLFSTGTNVVVKVRTTVDYTGDYFIGVTFTLRWPNSYGVCLGSIVSSFGIAKTGVDSVFGEYKYQKFVLANPSSTPINWVPGGEYTLLSMAVSQTGAGVGTFEIAPAGFFETGEGDPYLELQAAGESVLDPADPFYQNATTVAMPVELTAFTVTTDKQGALLTWKTATEKDNARFDIERTEIGASDAPRKWAAIGSVDGSGTTNAPKQYAFRNKNVQTGKYAYRLKQVDRDGGFKYSQEVEAVIAPPSVFALSQNYPNPFNPTSTVNFSLARKSAVSIKIYDITGREVQTVMQGEREAGYYTASIDGRMMASGVYLYRMIAASEGGSVYTETKRLMLLK